jgi:hypothetical protein
MIRAKSNQVLVNGIERLMVPWNDEISFQSLSCSGRCGCLWSNASAFQRAGLQTGIRVGLCATHDLYFVGIFEACKCVTS